jgi:hypothetical protein
MASFKNIFYWLVDGKRHYGDGLYQEAEKILGVPQTTLRNLKSISAMIELSRRCNNLTWGHHAREIKFTAARRIGELVPAEQGKRTDKEQEGKRTKRTKELHQDSVKSIIPQQRLSEFRKLAEIPEQEFKERIV